MIEYQEIRNNGVAPIRRTHPRSGGRGMGTVMVRRRVRVRVRIRVRVR